MPTPQAERIDTSGKLGVMPLSLRTCVLDFAGERLALLPERAVWWAAARTLFIADLHLGKAATYRALGQPVPAGSTQENLDRIDNLIEAFSPLQMVFLGDFLHAAQARTPRLLAAVESWRERNSELVCTLVRGNHDSRAGDPPKSLGFDVVDEPHLIGPFAACHHPRSHPTHAVLAGHLHPAIKLHGRGRDSLRMPCFVVDDTPLRMILPAFGEFTGGWLVEAAVGRRFFGVAGETVWAVQC